MQDKDFEGFLFVEPFNNMTAKFSIIQSGNADLVGTLTPKLYDDSLVSTLVIKPHNRMKTSYEIQQPPRITSEIVPSIDVTTRSKFPTINYGSGSNMIVGRDSNEVFRSYLKFDTDLLERQLTIEKAKLRLYYSGNLPSDTALEVYTVNKDWSEYTITDANRPQALRFIVDSFTVNSANKYIEFEFLDTLLKWYKKQEKNYGIVLRIKTESLGQKVTFYTRESNFKPRIIYTYFDNRIYSAGRTQLDSTLFINQIGDSDIQSTLEVRSDYGFDKFESTLYVHQRNVPVESDLSCVISVSHPQLESFLSVSLDGESNLDSYLEVECSGNDDYFSYLNVSKDFLLSEIEVKHRNDFETYLSVKQSDHEDFDSYLSVTYPEIDNSIFIKYNSGILNELTVSRLDNSNLNSYLSVSYPEIENELFIKFTDDFISNLYVSRYSEDDFTSYLSVTHPEIESNMTIRQVKDSEIDNEIIVRQSDFSQLENNLAVTRDSLHSYLKVTNYTDTLHNIYVKYREDIDNYIDVKQISELECTLEVRQFVDFDGTLTVTHPDLLGSIIVPYQIDEDVNQEITVRVRNVSDLHSEIFVSSKFKGYYFIM